jgi:hypothetical protein
MCVYDRLPKGGHHSITLAFNEINYTAVVSGIIKKSHIVYSMFFLFFKSEIWIPLKRYKTVILPRPLDKMEPYIFC